MKTIVSIPGMHCQSCVALIKDVSQDFPAIQSIDVDLESKTVTLKHDDSFLLTEWSKTVESLNDAYKVQAASP